MSTHLDSKAQDERGRSRARGATAKLRLITATTALLTSVMATVIVALPAAATASGTDIGYVADRRNTTCNGGASSMLQIADPSGAVFGTTVPGELTSWSTSGGMSSTGTRALQVWRPVAADQYELVFESARQSMAFDGIRTFAIPDPFTIQPGDRLGIENVGTTVGCIASRLSGGMVAFVGGSSTVGSVLTTDKAAFFESAAINVSAHLEPVDTSAPVITPHVSPAEPDGANGWYTTDPAVSFDVTDDESAVSDTSTGCAGGGVTADTAGTTYTCTATSAGGTGSNSVTVKRDATAPTATFDPTTTGIADGASYTWGSVPAAPTCTATDDLSGPDGCTVTGYSTAVGTHTVTATAQDNAGNTATTTRTYTVAPWKTTGFYQPVDMGGVLNTVKGGSTVPVKFRVHAGTTEVTDTSKIAFTAAKISCATGTIEDAVEVTATGATNLRYDTTAGQFIYNWATPKTPGVCYALTMTTADGTATKALFKLK